MKHRTLFCRLVFWLDQNVFGRSMWSVPLLILARLIPLNWLNINKKLNHYTVIKTTNMYFRKQSFLLN